MHRILATMLLALALVACGGGQPALTDPAEIVTSGLKATSELSSAHIEIAVDGTVDVAEMGTTLDLAGTKLEGDFDLANTAASLTFKVPAFLGVTGEVIALDGASYVKTSMTGAQWMKQETSGEDDPLSQAQDPKQALAELEKFLAMDGVETTKRDDVDCGEKTCYSVQLIIPASLLNEELAAEAPSDLIGEDDLVIELLFDKEKLYLTEASTSVTAPEMGTISITLTLSAFNESVSISAPPEDEVVEGNPFDLP